jgi:ABC-2 type transport system ATP-binding protein
VSSPAIQLRGVVKRFGPITAVDGLDLEVPEGICLGLLGPNGAGKSTTIGMLTTTIAPTSGSARLAGHDVVSEPLLARGVSSVVFQEPVVDRGRSGLENLELHARLWAVPPIVAATRIEELVEVLGLSALIARPVASYSGGERRRLEIARALVSHPEVLFLDEPTVGLDPRIRHELLDVIAGLRAREEMTIVLTTHYLDEAQRLCDRVAIIHAGGIVALDTPEALLAGLGEELLDVRVDGDGDGAHVLRSLRDRGAADEYAFAVGSTLTIPLRARSGGEVLAAIEELGLSAGGIATRTPTLDDVYLRLTGSPIGEAA